MILILNTSKHLVTLSFKISSKINCKYLQSCKKNFLFQCIFLNETLKEIGNLNSKNLIQAIDIPTKVIKENKVIISYYIYHNLITLCQVLHFLQIVLTYHQFQKKITKLIKKIWLINIIRFLIGSCVTTLFSF